MQRAQELKVRRAVTLDRRLLPGQILIASVPFNLLRSLQLTLGSGPWLKGITVVTQSEKDIYWWPLNNITVVIEFFLLVSLSRPESALQSCCKS